MNCTLRLALASPAHQAQPSVAALAWLLGLTRKAGRVQYSSSRACPVGTGVVTQITGLPGRHLDAWLMPPTVLRALFARGAGQAEVALVEGVLAPSPPPWLSCRDCSGSLGPIAESVDLPTVYLLPCPSARGFHLPHIPDEVDAIFLDGIDDAAEYEGLRRFVAMATGKPVLGALERLPEVRAAIERIPREHDVPEELLASLGRSFLRFADFAGIEALGRSRPAPGPRQLPEARGGGRLRVAYAMDEAFGGYFPDTLEALESFGADLLDFSPLRDERLPDRADLVMIGCGFPDAYAESLAENVSLIADIQAHVYRGRRLYAEGGGTAYLGRSLACRGATVKGACVFPFDAELVPEPAPPAPVERRLREDTWLGPSGTLVRGYLSGRWRLRPYDDPSPCRRPQGSLVAEDDVYFHHQAVGGLLHLHLASLDQVIAAFVDPSAVHGSSPARPS